MSDREFSEPSGGEPVGEVQAGAAEDFESVKARLIAESRRYRKRAQDAEAKLGEMEARALSAEQVREYRRLKAEADRQERELDARRREVSALTERLRRIVGSDRLKSALASRGVTRVDQAAYLLDRHVRVDLDGDEPVVRVVDAAGRPIADPAAGPEAAARWPRWRRTPPSGSRSSGSMGPTSTCGVWGSGSAPAPAGRRPTIDASQQARGTRHEARGVQQVSIPGPRCLVPGASSFRRATWPYPHAVTS